MTKIPVVIGGGHTLIRQGLAGIIASFDEFNVLASYASWEELLEGLTTQPELPMICVADLEHPDDQAFRQMQEITRQFAQINFLALSSYDMEYTVIRAFASGVRGYLLKSASAEDLRLAMLTLYNGNYYHAALISNRILHMLQHARSPLPNISEREIEFLHYCCTELTYQEIAAEMHLSVRTIEGYRDSLFNKLGIRSRTGLAVYALKTGLISLHGLPDTSARGRFEPKTTLG